MRKQILILCSLFLCLTLFGQAQNRVTGTVTSQDGAKISASILIKGTTQGASTDAAGNYTLNNVPSTATLIFSSIGYKTQEQKVNNRSVINVSLEPDAQALDEVIMVAYGTSTKGTFTGAASVINEKDIRDVTTTSFQDALAGKAAGVQVTSGSGQAGTTTSIHIRGIGSMNASKEPLYVIDGVPVVSGSVGQLGDIFVNNNVMNSLNPADIESITILKDAAASSLYGSRAANGVVVINTKKGKVGRPQINLRSSIGFTPTWATDNYETASTQESVNILYRVFHDLNTSAGKTDAVANADALRRLNLKFNMHGYNMETSGTGLSENVIIKGLTDGIENREGKYFDWEDALFRTGTYQTNDISVSGGDQNTKYYSSLSYTKDQSRVKLNNFDRIAGRVNLSQKIGKHVEFITNVSISNNTLSGYNDTRNTGSNYYYQSRNLLWGLYWPTNYKTGNTYTARYGSLAQNPIYYDNEWENKGKTLKISANETMVVNILPELSLRSIFSYDNTQSKDHIYYSAKHFSGSATEGLVNEMSTSINKIISSTTLNYDKNFGVHGLNVLAGFEAEKNETDYHRSTGKKLASSSLHTVATAGELDATGYFWGNTMLSVLSRAEYNYDQKYYGSASFRRDGSSRLGPETRWGNFWSLAGAWRIDKEKFMEDNNYISNLRLKASYGVNGTLPSSNYGWRSLIGYSNKYMEQAGGGISTIADPTLTWETSYTTNLAIEFGLFNQRLYGSIEYFNRDSRDLLQDVPISGVTGFGSTLKNVGVINNKGFEIELGGDIIRNDKLRWSASLNASMINSKVTKLYRNEGEKTGQDIIWSEPLDGESLFIYREGESTLAFYGIEWAGVDPATGLNRWFVNNPTDKAAGDFVLDGRGATLNYKNANRVIIGNAMPKVYGGISTSVEYKNLTLGFNFIYKIGGKLYDGADNDVADDGYYWERIHSKRYYDNMWTKENPKGTLGRVSGNDLEDVNQYSSRHIYDASMLRLKSVTLAYNLPKTLLNKVGINNTRLYFTGSNLLTFSKYKNADPEVNQYATRAWETPFAKTYTFGIDLNF